MKTLISTVILMFFLVCTALSQGYVFRVLANKGTNQVKRASNGETQPLKTGATLNIGDELIASSGAYIGLMHKTGKTIEVRTAGTTKISDLEKKLAAAKTDVANRYAQFVMNKMNEGDGNVNANYRRNSKATGAVERAASNSAIKVMLPSSIDILNPNAVIRWSEGVENTMYLVSVKNIFDEEIFKAETQDTSIKINFDDENLANERLVIFNVQVKGNDEMKSSDYGIKRMSADDAQSINENLDILKAEISDDTPLNKLIYASFYEENNLLLDALTKYEEAIELSPEVEDFKSLYDDFLTKNGLN
ncbi:MAG: hypothetical protein ACJA2S_002929 [Cyclobacteriaceae bacterium]|jgi:hypothetical protein